MDARQLLDLIESGLKDYQTQGHTTVSIEKMRAANAIALKMIEEDEKRGVPEDREARLAHYNAQLEHWVDASKNQHAWRIELFRSAISAGEGALKACMTINGGAAVALLAFAGHLVDHAVPTMTIAGVAQSMALFVAGVLAAALGYGFRYVSQALYAHAHEKTGMIGQVVSTISGLASLALFSVGGYAAYLAITGRSLFA